MKLPALPILVLLPSLLFSQSAPKPKSAAEIHKMHQDSKATFRC
jgi:hypothetical protein